MVSRGYMVMSEQMTATAGDKLDRVETLASISSSADLQLFVVNMPNVAGIQSQPGTAYRRTVDAVGAATGYDFLPSPPDAIETVVESMQS
jgi:hypothetical protein